ncbi:hypothetical protein ACSSS7_007321 [Eimeria intestinalis]
MHAGLQYSPVFSCFSGPDSPFKETAWRVCVDSFVASDSGSGIVHCAPAFGEDDYRICTQNGIISVGGPLPCPVDDNGRMTSEVSFVAGEMFKDADKKIKILLKESNSLLASSDYVHSYPFCWRSDTPLIYKAVPSWFVRVEEMREKLQQINKETKWQAATAGSNSSNSNSSSNSSSRSSGSCCNGSSSSSSSSSSTSSSNNSVSNSRATAANSSSSSSSSSISSSSSAYFSA